MKSMLICICALGLSACGRNTPQGAMPPSASFEQEFIENTTLPQRLAILDEGRYVAANHLTAARFASLLQQLDNQYVENSQHIANITVFARNLLLEKGIDTPLLTIMEGVNRLYFYPSHTNEEYANMVGLYATLRDRGMTHEETIDGMQGMIQAVGLAP